MRIAIVGRGRLGGALAASAGRAGHDVVLLRRAEARPDPDPPAPEAALDDSFSWDGVDLVVLAFERHASSVADLTGDPTLRRLRDVPRSVPIASVVMSPPTELLDAFLPDHAIAHFLTTPAARLPGAVALLPGRSPAETRLREAFPSLQWTDCDADAYRKRGVLLIGSAMAAAALAHLGRLLGAGPNPDEAGYLSLVLDDAKRLLELTDGDGFAAFSLVATPGGFTETIHNRIFQTPWPLDEPHA